MKILFMGTPDFAVESLKCLINSKHVVSAVVTQPDKRRNRGKVSFSPVKAIALNSDIEIIQPFNIKNNEDFIEKIKAIEFDLIVVVAFGQILPKKVLEIPRYGCINVHGSLLPNLRGASPIHHAILNNEEYTGISIMKMEEGLDSGPIYSIAKTKIDNKYIEELHDELSVMGGKLLIKTIDKIEYEGLEPKEQNHKISTYAPIISKVDGQINFNENADYIQRKIRAFNTWPGAYANLDGKTYKFFRSDYISTNSLACNGEIIGVDDAITVKCKQGAIKITEIQAQGKKRMKVSEFIKGNQIKIGMKFE